MTKNGKPSNEPVKEFELHVPEGIDKHMAQAIFQNLVQELHMLEPLLPDMVKLQVAQGLLGDHLPIGRLRQVLMEAPVGAEWSVGIVRPSALILPGASMGVAPREDGFALHAKARLGECKDLEEVMRTITCFALLTSAPARGLLTMHGYKIKIVPPHVPEAKDPDEEELS